jgi:hypothetical protein
MLCGEIATFVKAVLCKYKKKQYGNYHIWLFYTVTNRYVEFYKEVDLIHAYNCFLFHTLKFKYGNGANT